jgi:hypothetical protein
MDSVFQTEFLLQGVSSSKPQKYKRSAIPHPLPLLMPARVAPRRRVGRWVCDAGVKHITVPAFVTSLTIDSFRQATALKSVAFAPGSTIQELVSNTFCYCESLKSISIPPSVKTIHPFLFYDPVTYFERCRLETITFEKNSNLENIGPHAFYGCDSLTSIFLPASVTLLNGLSFAACGLRQIAIEANNRWFHVKGNFLMTLDDIKMIRYFGSSSEVMIGDEIEEIGTGCFADCDSISRVALGSSSKVSLIGARAFEWCFKLQSISLPSSVTDLAVGCFKGCISLRDVTFCSSSELSFLRASAFTFCTSLEVINLPSSLQTISEHCFATCKFLVTITFPSDSRLDRIEGFAFLGCSLLKAFAIPGSVTFIGESCFKKCDAFSKLTFMGVPQHRALLDLPPHLVGTQEIPDSVEIMWVSGEIEPRCFRAVSFGRESKLAEIKGMRTKLASAPRCVVHASTASLKVFRLRLEFGNYEYSRHLLQCFGFCICCWGCKLIDLFWGILVV